MAKTCWIERAKRTPKFKVRAVRRCQRCGRSRACCASSACAVSVSETLRSGEDPGRAQGELVREIEDHEPDRSRRRYADPHP